MSPDLQWRASVATLARVLFEHPLDGNEMLALERRASVIDRGRVRLRAQPFGGAVHILQPEALRGLIGEIVYDSAHSRSQQDLRILIPPSKWEPLKEFCLRHLSDPHDAALESSPHRELEEEFGDALKIKLERGQYAARHTGFVIENDPSPTDNLRAAGLPTVRLYSIFEVRLLDRELCQMIAGRSGRVSDQELQALAQQDAQRGGQGHAHTVLALPLDLVTESYRSTPAERRYAEHTVGAARLDPSVLAVLDGIGVPRFERLQTAKRL